MQVGVDGQPVKVAADSSSHTSEAVEDDGSIGMCVTIGVSGWLSDSDDSFSKQWLFLRQAMNGTELHALRWESELLIGLGEAFEGLVKSYLTSQLGKAVAVRVGLGATVAALALPATLYTAANLVDNPWSMAVARADKAGVLLAKLLLERQQGHRPIILAGWSCGARMIFRCLEILAEAGESGRGIVDSCFLLGCPVEAKAERWGKARTVIADRFVNGYAPAGAHCMHTMADLPSHVLDLKF
eukprot:SAG31_NODE_391_length_16344_cov_15.753339_3_plen_242_part_00